MRKFLMWVLYRYWKLGHEHYQLKQAYENERKLNAFCLSVAEAAPGWKSVPPFNEALRAVRELRNAYEKQKTELAKAGLTPTPTSSVFDMVKVPPIEELVKTFPLAEIAQKETKDPPLSSSGYL